MEQQATIHEAAMAHEPAHQGDKTKSYFPQSYPANIMIEIVMEIGGRHHA